MPKVKKGMRERSSLIITRSRRRNEQEKALVPILNIDIMTEIFYRLAADLLHKNFRFQCKEWYNVISAPICKPGIIYFYNKYDYDTRRIGFMEFQGMEMEMEMKMRDMNIVKADLIIISSCNGLVLLKERILSAEKIKMKAWGPIILNPTTMESVRVPPCEHECLCHDLVFIPCTQEFKVVDMFYDSSTPVFHVRSVGGGWNETCVVLEHSLRGIDVPGSYRHMLSGVYWNERVFIGGILYFNYGSRRGIISFDICNQRGRMLKLPVAKQNISGEWVRLIEFNGFLCLVDCIGDKENRALDLWIFKDINTEEWEKKHRIDGVFDTLYRSGCCWYKVLGSLKDGEVIVFANKNHIYAYEIKTRLWTSSTVDVGNSFHYGPRVHVNNFVSIT